MSERPTPNQDPQEGTPDGRPRASSSGSMYDLLNLQDPTQNAQAGTSAERSDAHPLEVVLGMGVMLVFVIVGGLLLFSVLGLWSLGILVGVALLAFTRL